MSPFFRCTILLIAFSSAVFLGGTDFASADDAVVRKDIQFATVDGHPLKLDLYLPRQDDAPLVVFIHGGGWKNGSKNRCLVKWLTEDGYAVASISYRLTDKAIFPAQIHDCKGAVRWLRAHADEFGYRSDRIAVAGTSAGGHLATLLGTTGGVEELEGDVGGNTDHSSRVDAIVDYYGPTDFLLRTKTQPHKTIEEGSSVRLLLGGPADKMVELARKASPVFHVTSDDPPLLVFHGRRDKTVLIGQANRIVDAYRQKDLPVTLRVLDNSGHGGQKFFVGESRKQLVTFLDKQLKVRAASGTDSSGLPE